ncbi:MAG TPA: ZIP family metal transporter, partial [Elusimicrobiota bacterium]|nr:ZIP family metal transporter [Elusimicrobiota bacterium]
ALAVVVHKFSDGMTLSSLFLGAGHAPGRAGRLSTVLSLATPLGVLTGGFLGPRAAGPGLAVLLGLAGGGFLYVSMADVLPRIHRNRDPWCWTFLVVGMIAGATLPHP